MENNKRIRPLSQTEKEYAAENYHLINKFLKLSKLDAEEFWDVVVLDFLLAVEIYLNNDELRKKCNFEACSYMYMKRAVYRYFREQKALKRCSEAGADISYEEIETYNGKSACSMENFSSLEYLETIKQIEENLTAEQQRIFFDKLDGYSLKEIAENIGIKPKRVYKQFGVIKNIVTYVIENQRLFG